MQPLPFSLDMTTVRDPVRRPGWYVLGRTGSGPWQVIQSREHYQHIIDAWANCPVSVEQRLLVFVEAGRPAMVIATSNNQ